LSGFRAADQQSGTQAQAVASSEPRSASHRRMLGRGTDADYRWIPSAAQGLALRAGSDRRNRQSCVRVLVPRSSEPIPVGCYRNLLGASPRVSLTSPLRSRGALSGRQVAARPNGKTGRKDATIIVA